jgi:ubiquinone/menaquinone biosynthesis C-methylase UbiE
VSRSHLDRYVKAYTGSSVYDLENALTFTWYADRITTLSPSGDLLELGIGHGVATKKFSAAYNRHVIIEGSRAVIRSFRKKCPSTNVTIVESSFEGYESDETFDVVVMGFVLEHVDDPGLILRRYQRYLKPTGRLYVAVPNAWSLHRRIGFEAGLLKDIYEFNDYDRAAGHKRYFDSTSIRNLVERSGYLMTRMEGLFLKPITTNQMKILRFSQDVMKAMLKVGIAYPELSNAVLLQASLEKLDK